MANNSWREKCRQRKAMHRQLSRVGIPRTKDGCRLGLRKRKMIYTGELVGGRR